MNPPYIGLTPKVIPLKLFLDMVPSSLRMSLACCVDVFVEDLLMFRFFSKQRKASDAVGMSSLIF